jgi:hypothetical protein
VVCKVLRSLLSSVTVDRNAAPNSPTFHCRKRWLQAFKYGIMDSKETGFVIMQIGNKELDNLYDFYISKAIIDAGLVPIRIDKHNEGGLLKSEIVKHIENSIIIIADLTNERPNCYLEIGYAMGLDKLKNLILTARKDHYYDDPEYKKNGPKIHFDLSGYDIIFWNPDNLEQFRKDLALKIQRRILRIKPKNSSQLIEHWDNEWLSDKRIHVESQLNKMGIKGYMEIRSMIPFKVLNISQSDLLNKAKESLINNFGWPIGIIDERILQPIPKVDGVISEIFNDSKKMFDYSYYLKSGHFYTATSHFEDSKNTNLIIVKTRILRVAEVFMFLSKYYTNVGLDINDSFEIIFKHTGLEGRLLWMNYSYNIMENRKSNEDEIEITIQTSILEIENNLVDLVSNVIEPLLILFNFFKIDKGIISNYVNEFVGRRI